MKEIPNHKSVGSHDLSILVEKIINQTLKEYTNMNCLKKNCQTSNGNIDLQIEQEFFEDTEVIPENSHEKSAENEQETQNPEHEFDSLKMEQLGPIKSKNQFRIKSQVKISQPFSMTGLILEKMPNYNGLKDEHLQGFFFNDKRKRILIKNGLITNEGFLIKKPVEYLKKKDIFQKTKLIEIKHNEIKVCPYGEIIPKMKQQGLLNAIKHTSKSIKKINMTPKISLAKSNSVLKLISITKNSKKEIKIEQKSKHLQNSVAQKSTKENLPWLQNNRNQNAANKINETVEIQKPNIINLKSSCFQDDFGVFPETKTTLVELKNFIINDGSAQKQTINESNEKSINDLTEKTSKKENLFQKDLLENNLSEAKDKNENLETEFENQENLETSFNGIEIN